jgi:hypothetical protein
VSPTAASDVPPGRGSWVAGASEQRQRPAASRLLDHPRTVYLREADLLPYLDGWLGRRWRTSGYRWSTVQVRVRVTPSTTWIRETTSRPS